MSFFIWSYPEGTHGQLKPPGSSSTTSSSGNSVSVSASVTVQISNETLEVKDKMLRQAVISFLNSGPNMLKSSDSDQRIIKTQIANHINNDTQNVQGIEATNANVGVEISKALKTIISSTNPPNQNGMVKVETTSTCNSSGGNVVSCDNTITIN